MKFLFQVIATILCCFVVQTFLPWWTMAIIAFAFGYYFNLSQGLAFLAGFISAGLLWFAKAFYIDVITQSILTEKVNKLMPLNVFVMVVIVSGLVGGFASFTGALVKGKKRARYY